MSSTYKKGNKVYWEWRHAAKKALLDIAFLRDLTTRFHHDKKCNYSSDKTLVKEIRLAIKRYFLFLDERDNPNRIH